MKKSLKRKDNSELLTFQKALEASKSASYVLRLYVTGATRRSAKAIANVKRICDEHFAGRYELEVIDIYQQPERARDAQIIATPTLVKKLPLPLRRFIGDMSDTEKFLVGIDLKPKKS